MSSLCLPNQLGVCGITHVALVARGVGVHRLKVFHVRLPHICQYLLLLLEPELTCKFRLRDMQYVVYRVLTCILRLRCTFYFTKKCPFTFAKKCTSKVTYYTIIDPSPLKIPKIFNNKLAGVGIITYIKS